LNLDLHILPSCFLSSSSHTISTLFPSPPSLKTLLLLLLLFLLLFWRERQRDQFLFSRVWCSKRRSILKTLKEEEEEDRQTASRLISFCKLGFFPPPPLFYYLLKSIQILKEREREREDDDGRVREEDISSESKAVFGEKDISSQETGSIWWVLEQC